jgi:DNA-binding transcriptional LysR family regulator
LTIGVHASLSAGNLRATLVDHRQRFPEVEMQLVDGSSDHLISDAASSAIDVAFVAENQGCSCLDGAPWSRESWERWEASGAVMSSACLRGTDRSAGRDEKIRLVLSPNQFYALIFGANSP